MPVIQVSVWTGISPENKKNIVVRMTNVLEELGIPKFAISVIINEIPKTNWGNGGVLASEMPS